MSDIVEKSSEVLEEERKSAGGLRSFRATGYVNSSWEVVGERVPLEGFSPMKLSVLSSSQSADSFFLNFDDHTTKRGPDKLIEAEAARAKSAEAILSEQFKQHYDQGYEAGYQTAKAEMQAALEQQLLLEKEKFMQLSGDISKQVHIALSSLETKALELSLEVAKRILVTTAELKPDYIVEIIRKGISLVGASTPLKVKVSPQDYEFIKVVGLPPELSASELGLEYQADESIESGCIIETNYGAINLELDSMWEQVKESIFEVIK